jgi:N utilization substance protein B
MKVVLFLNLQILIFIMKTKYRPNQSPRVIIIQKLYGNFFNDDTDLTFPKHRFKKFIKDVVLGTIERDEVIIEEIENHLNEDLQLTKLDKVFQIIIKSAIFEFLYKPKVSTKIIIKEYLDASNFFLENSQTKYLNAILDKIAKKIRTTNA